MASPEEELPKGPLEDLVRHAKRTKRNVREDVEDAQNNNLQPKNSTMKGSKDKTMDGNTQVGKDKQVESKELKDKQVVEDKQMVKDKQDESKEMKDKQVGDTQVVKDKQVKGKEVVDDKQVVKVGVKQVVEDKQVVKDEQVMVEKNIEYKQENYVFQEQKNETRLQDNYGSFKEMGIQKKKPRCFTAAKYISFKEFFMEKLKLTGNLMNVVVKEELRVKYKLYALDHQLPNLRDSSIGVFLGELGVKYDKTACMHTCMYGRQTHIYKGLSWVKGQANPDYDFLLHESTQGKGITRSTIIQEHHKNNIKISQETMNYNISSPPELEDFKKFCDTHLEITNNLADNVDLEVLFETYKEYCADHNTIPAIAELANCYLRCLDIHCLTVSCFDNNRRFVYRGLKWANSHTSLLNAFSFRTATLSEPNKQNESTTENDVRTGSIIPLITSDALLHKFVSERVLVTNNEQNIIIKDEFLQKFNSYCDDMKLTRLPSRAVYRYLQWLNFDRNRYFFCPYDRVRKYYYPGVAWVKDCVNPEYDSLTYLSYKCKESYKFIDGNHSVIQDSDKKSIKNTLLCYKGELNSFEAFFNDSLYLTKDLSTFVLKDNVHLEYTKYCKENKSTPASLHLIGCFLMSLGLCQNCVKRLRVEGKPVRVMAYCGLAWTDGKPHKNYYTATSKKTKPSQSLERLDGLGPALTVGIHSRHEAQELLQDRGCFQNDLPDVSVVITFG